MRLKEILIFFPLLIVTTIALYIPKEPRPVPIMSAYKYLLTPRKDQWKVHGELPPQDINFTYERRFGTHDRRWVNPASFVEYADEYPYE